MVDNMSVNSQLLRKIPKVDELLRHEQLSSLSCQHTVLTEAVREVIDSLRQQILAGEEPSMEIDSICNEVIRCVTKKTTMSLRPVINATGIVLHTNLGRAKLSDAAVRAIQSVAQDYNTLEYNLEKGSRGSRRGADRTPMIIAFGLILILVIIIAMIIRSMFSAGTPQTINTPEPQTQAEQATMGPNFMVFGQTPTPATMTATPGIEITPSPTPTTQPVTTYKTLRKGDQGAEVVTLQQALVELGYLNGATDGNFGTGTETAVKNFQAASGLDADGIAGKLTLEALFKLSSVTPMPEVTVGPGDILDLPG